MTATWWSRGLVLVAGVIATAFAQPARWADDPVRLRRVLIIGDSLAATDFGAALERRLDAHPQVECRRFGKSATGLARPDYYDWTRRATRLLERHDPDVVIVIIGGNDGQDLLNVRGKGRVRYRTVAWEPEYERRLYHFGELLAQDGRRVLWLELPAMARPRFEAKLRKIRALQDEVAAVVPRNRYVETRRFFYDEQGRLRTRVPGARRENRRAMRQGDGIHFTRAGADYFARRVLSDVLEGVGLDADGGPEASARPRGPRMRTRSEPSTGASLPSRRAER